MSEPDQVRDQWSVRALTAFVRRRARELEQQLYVDGRERKITCIPNAALKPTLRLLQPVQHSPILCRRAASSRSSPCPLAHLRHSRSALSPSCLTELLRADYVAIVRRAASEAGEDRVTAIAAALAYYAFLSIPFALLLAVGIFSLVADPDTVSSLVDELGKSPAGCDPYRPGQPHADDSARRNRSRADRVGGVPAVWSIGGAMET